MSIERLLKLDEQARKHGARFPKRRNLYDQIASTDGRHFIAIVGPRGVGKTVLLRQIANDNQHAFYISLDTLEDEDNLFDVAQLLVERYDVELLLLDEVHWLSDFEKHLKRIFDFLSLRVLFTSSVALSLHESSYDLSRRVRLYHLYPFSFREYLRFTRDISVSRLELSALVNQQTDLQHLHHIHRFKDYLMGGLLPFSLHEPDIMPLLRNIQQKVIRRDIPSVARLRLDELDDIEDTLKFIGRSPVDGINYSSISKNVGITKYKSKQYVQLLQAAYVLNPVFPAGTNVLKEPKVLMCLPFRLLYQDYEDALGAIREDFAAETMLMASLDFHYLKSTRGSKTPDFLVEYRGKELVIEVGGKRKGREQFKGVKPTNQKLILSHGGTHEEGRIPLALFGYIV